MTVRQHTTCTVHTTTRHNQPTTHVQHVNTSTPKDIRTSRARTSTTLPSSSITSSHHHIIIISKSFLSCLFSTSQQYQHIIDITDLRGGEVECPISMLCYCTTGRGGARMSGHELVCTKYVRCTWIVYTVLQYYMMEHLEHLHVVGSLFLGAMKQTKRWSFDRFVRATTTTDDASFWG